MNLSTTESASHPLPLDLLAAPAPFTSQKGSSRQFESLLETPRPAGPPEAVQRDASSLHDTRRAPSDEPPQQTEEPQHAPDGSEATGEPEEVLESQPEAATDEQEEDEVTAPQAAAAIVVPVVIVPQEPVIESGDSAVLEAEIGGEAPVEATEAEPITLGNPAPTSETELVITPATPVEEVPADAQQPRVVKLANEATQSVNGEEVPLADGHVEESGQHEESVIQESSVSPANELSSTEPVALHEATANEDRQASAEDRSEQKSDQHQDSQESGEARVETDVLTAEATASVPIPSSQDKNPSAVNGSAKVDSTPATNSSATSNSAASNSAINTPQPIAQRLPAHLVAAGEKRGSSGSGPVEVDTVRLLNRVARAFTAAQERDGEVRLRLSPPELGSLKLEVRMHEGVMVARVETETSAARTALIESLPALRERLAEQGVRIERFDIDLMQRQPGDTPDRPFDQQPQDSPSRPLRATQPAARATLDAPTRRITTIADDRRLNVII